MRRKKSLKLNMHWEQWIPNIANKFLNLMMFARVHSIVFCAHFFNRQNATSVYWKIYSFDSLVHTGTQPHWHTHTHTYMMCIPKLI